MKCVWACFKVFSRWKTLLKEIACEPQLFEIILEIYQKSTILNHKLIKTIHNKVLVDTNYRVKSLIVTTATLHCFNTSTFSWKYIRRPLPSDPCFRTTETGHGWNVFATSGEFGVMFPSFAAYYFWINLIVVADLICQKNYLLA